MAELWMEVIGGVGQLILWLRTLHQVKYSYDSKTNLTTLKYWGLTIVSNLFMLVYVVLIGSVVLVFSSGAGILHGIFHIGIDKGWWGKR